MILTDEETEWTVMV